MTLIVGTLFFLKRLVRGMNTDVWAAPRTFLGKQNLYEWYFMADGWQSFTFEGLHRQYPVLMMMYEEDKVDIRKTNSNIKSQLVFVYIFH